MEAMHPRSDRRPTIGFLSTWSVYEGTTIDSYTNTLLQGISAAASEQHANLLIGCGISLPGSPRGSRTAWPVSGEWADFVPVGPWNCDGLIIIPDDLTTEQLDYIQDLIRSKYPVIFTTPERAGHQIAADNAGGIRQACQHLFQHGHRQIAFVAGKSDRGGDSAERLAAYHLSLQELNLPRDERLIAYGEHRREDGRLAMRKILATGAPFTAVIASNDLSALGAMEVLRSSGLRIPEDVAVIGFDDILEARSQIPPLTTVRHPTFSLGYQAVLSILQEIRGETRESENRRVATQLVIRQSCGCRPDTHKAGSVPAFLPENISSTKVVLADWMAEIALIEARQSLRKEITDRSKDLAASLIDSLVHQDLELFEDRLQDLYQWLETHPEDAYAWQSVFNTLRNSLPDLLSTIPNQKPGFTTELIEHARLGLAESIRRQTTGALVKHMTDADRLGLMTSQLLAAADVADSANILARHLPLLGINQALAGLYSQAEEDPLLHTDILLSVGLNEQVSEGRFLTRQFPTPPIIPSEKPFQLAILPLLIDEHATGFVAFSATNLEPCAAIVHNLASALRAIQLYREALRGRQLAEEANQLKSRFLSIVSHELQTPLSLIVGLSEMILQAQPEQTGAALPDPLLQDLGKIYTSAQHLARLIGDVLDLASSEAGQLRILREPLDLADVLRVTARIGEQLAHDKGLAWESRLPDRGPWVLGDRTRLRQVALNLISNAVKFTSQGKVTLEVTVSGKLASISVNDTGIGISPSEQAKVFVEFQRSERSLQSGYSGMGLGLAISRQLVEQHGGSLSVSSPGALGSGSTFYFTLPILTAKGWQDELAPALPAQGQAVFVLTEHAEPADLLSEHLRQSGFDTQVCRIDQDAEWLARITTKQPAALILEEDLAGKQGWAITSLLKRQPTTAGIPIFAFALDAAQDRGELLELNYLHKPLQADQLAAEFFRYFGTKPALSGDRPQTVLLVDDDPGVLEVNQRLVEQAGCRPILARNGKEALTALETTLPDLILLDLMMPEMDGFSVLDALRERESTRNIPVIILTAKTLSDADLERCNRGVATILTKGVFNTAETLSHIEAVLNQQNTLSQPTQRLVRQAVAWIHTHYAESLTREDIAQRINISPDYLTDCFRQEMGITPITYLRRYRIRKACDLLKNTDMSITEVAMAVGFSESAHFTRTFHHEVGLTPRAYRRTGA